MATALRRHAHAVEAVDGVLKYSSGSLADIAPMVPLHAVGGGVLARHRAR